MNHSLAPCDSVEIVEVGPRDGFQPIGPFIETGRKLGFVERSRVAGFRRVEIGSFVSPKALPQMADTPDLLASLRVREDLLPQVLVPNERWGLAAIDAGAPMIAFVLSVSEAHNRNNVRRSPNESAAEYERLMAGTPLKTIVRLNLATAFDCPFDGRVAPEAVLDLLDRLVPVRPGAEICLCDTTGKATPDEVEALFRAARERFPAVAYWAMHGHDTYGLGAANAFAAYRAGCRVFDGAFGGLGGCPFAPGATGNTASEDLAWMFERMGITTGLDIAALAALGDEAAALPGAQAGGRVRAALRCARAAAHRSVRGRETPIRH